MKSERNLSRLAFLVAISLMTISILSGCKTTKYVPVDKVTYRDIIKHDTLHRHDSIYVHDSITTTLKGDTVFRDRWHRETILKETYKTKIDSFTKVDSIPIPYPIEKELTKWQQFQLKYAVWSMGAMCALLVVLGVIIYRRIKNGKSNNSNNKK
jgi:disulfide bond formation protein DsbB